MCEKDHGPHSHWFFIYVEHHNTYSRIAAPIWELPRSLTYNETGCCCWWEDSVIFDEYIKLVNNGAKVNTSQQRTEIMKVIKVPK